MITSTSNPTVKWLRSLQSRRRAREQERLFIIEGLRLAREALASALPASLVLYTEDFALENQEILDAFTHAGAESKEVSVSVMASVSDTETPQGLLVVLPEPALKPPSAPSFCVIADRLADPGNLGTLLRTSWAAGVDLVMITEGSVDPFNPKVVRGAMGAHFKLPLQLVPAEQAATLLPHLKFFLAEARSGLPYYSADWRGEVGLIVGAEATGPQTALRDLAHAPVHIPMAQGVDSLNAAIAAAVILFEAARQRGDP
jgi:TrmH family RNA methyltransferase